MVKVVQLGCGLTGLVCAQHLESNPRVDELVLADKRIEPAASYVDKNCTDKTSLAKVDAAKPSDLKKLLRSCDILVTSVPSEMNASLLGAALAAGVDYVDFTIPLETIPRFDEVGKACVDAGITALTAVGSDPGISDIFALHGAGKLDEVHEIHIKDADNAVHEKHELFTLWCPRDMLEEITMNAAVYDRGEIRWLPPLSRSEVFNFPRPIGPHRVYNTTHEETFLIPRFLKEVRYVDFMIAVPDKLVEAANTLRKLGLHGLKPIAADGVEVKPLDVVAACFPSPVDLVGEVSGSSGIVVEAKGLRSGEQATVRTWVAMTHEEAFKKYRSSGTGYLVGTGAAVGAEMIVSKDISKSGLYVPEMLPVGKYLEKLREKDLVIHEETVVA